MKASTEEFIYFLLWGADTLTRSTRRNLESSFEQWAFRSGLGRRLQILKREKLLQQLPDAHDASLNERVIRLTESGRVAALGGVDPAAAWKRSWDGHWRLVIFDLPDTQNKQRVKLRRTLKDLRFGYLQNSVWISPDPLANHVGKLVGAHIDVEALTLFEGRPSGGESDQDLVRGAWNFAVVQQRYDVWTKVAAQAPKLGSRSEGAAAWKSIRQWAARERAAWAAVTACDPFLPAALLPAGYPGQKCWTQRIELLGNLAVSL